MQELPISIKQYNAITSKLQLFHNTRQEIEKNTVLTHYIFNNGDMSVMLKKVCFNSVSYFGRFLHNFKHV